MLHNNFELRVLVKGRPITEYAHNGQNFVEGRDSSNFEIEFANRSALRVEAVISVDGLSVIDGKAAGPQSSGYVVDPFGTLRIPGWKLTDEAVAAFVFAGKKASYATQSTGSERNNGVIGALVFAERRQDNYQLHPFHGAQSFGGGMMRSMASGSGPSFTDAYGDLGDIQPKGITASLNNVSTSLTSSAEVGTAQAAAPEAAPVVQSLGTGFGEATDFATTTVTFNRGDLAAMIVMYYDDSRGLRARGIELTRPSRQRIAKAVQPQAFPGMNCVPPAGWKG
jgi:hypothetical protein